MGTNLSSPPHSFSTLFIATFKEIIFNASYLGLFNVSFSISTRKRKRKLSNLPHLVARVEAVGHGVLVDVEGRQPQRQLVLQLRGEPLLHHVVAALKEENIFILYTNILYLFKWEVKYFQHCTLNIFHWIELLKIFLHYGLDILPAHRGTRKPRSLSAAARRRPRARRWRGTGSGGCAHRAGRRSGYLLYIVHNKNIRWWDNAIIISAVWCWVGSDKLNWTWLIGFCLIL